jgi:hypothetical protein
MNPLSLIFGGVVTAVKEVSTMWMEGRQKKHAAKMAHIGKVIQGQADYNSLAQHGMAASLKDEFLTIWITALVSLHFYPPMQPYLEHGWKMLATVAPDWFGYCFVGMWVAVFGLKGWKIFKNSQ